MFDFVILRAYSSADPLTKLNGADSEGFVYVTTDIRLTSQTVTKFTFSTSNGYKFSIEENDWEGLDTEVLNLTMFYK